MKRLLIAFILGSFVLSYAQDTSKVLLFMRNSATSGDLEFMLKKEVGVMMDTLKKYGYKVVVATLDGKDVTKGSTTVKADFKLSDAKVADYAGFILPCLAVPSVPEPPDVSPDAITLVKNAVAAGKPVAAQLGSVWTLAEAGVLKGKKFAYAMQDNNSLFSGATYAGTGVVRDGLIITSGICPYMEKQGGGKDGTPLLALTFVQVMKEIATPILNSATAPFVNQSCKLQVQLFTFTGRAIYKGMVKTKIGIMQIPTTGFPNGAYIVNISDGKDIKVSSKRLLMR
jgi:putative intracellular protease/amidase